MAICWRLRRAQAADEPNAPSACGTAPGRLRGPKACRGAAHRTVIQKHLKAIGFLGPRAKRVLDSRARSSDAAEMSYPGGKAGAGVYQTLINLMPPHQIYVEPFLGAGSVMRLKKPAQLNIGIDMSLGRVLETRKAILNLPITSPKASTITDTDRGHTYRWIAGDGIDWLAYLSASTGPVTAVLVYCDPPYLMSTRSGRRLFDHELAEEEHTRLLEVICRLKCNVMISGYSSPLYAKALKSWHAYSYQTTTRGGLKVAEWVWCNFPRPIALHDYRFLGDNYRERERIKRKQVRWRKRLTKMPVLERQALLSAIADTA